MCEPQYVCVSVCVEGVGGGGGRCLAGVLDVGISVIFRHHVIRH